MLEREPMEPGSGVVHRRQGRVADINNAVPWMTRQHPQLCRLCTPDGQDLQAFFPSFRRGGDGLDAYSNSDASDAEWCRKARSSKSYVAPVHALAALSSPLFRLPLGGDYDILGDDNPLAFRIG